MSRPDVVIVCPLCEVPMDLVELGKHDAVMKPCCFGFLVGHSVLSSIAAKRQSMRIAKEKAADILAGVDPDRGVTSGVPEVRRAAQRLRNRKKR